MNSKCVTAGQILRFLAYSAVESVHLCVHAHSVICARVVCLRVFGLLLSSSSSSSSSAGGVREFLRSPDHTFLPRLQNLKAALFSSRKVRESHASTCFFLIFSWFFLDFFSSVFFAGSLLFKFLLFLFFFLVRFRFVTVCSLRILRRGKSVAMMQCAPDRI